MRLYSYEAISLSPLNCFQGLIAEAECMINYPSMVEVNYKLCHLEKQQQLNCFLYGNMISSAI